MSVEIRPRVHLICNAHLDPVWQWRWQEGCAEALTTFRVAARLLREHDSFIFNHNEAVLYQWVLEYDPALFREIQRLVAEGRWCITGGWFLQPDANLPDTESLIGQMIAGRRFFQRHFGVAPRVAYNLDSFGHTGGLPQLLRRFGYEFYIFQRPDRTQRTLPADLFRWRGVDGSEVGAYRIEFGLYHTERTNIEQRLAEGAALARKLGRDVPVFWGLGDHGGGATREDLARIDRYLAAARVDADGVEYCHATLESFCEALRPALAVAPIVEGDLQRVFTGCYSSLARIKRRAQRSAAKLRQAEALCAAAWWRHGREFDAERFSALWQKNLFNDFHDILPGTCTASAEQDALDLYGEVSEGVRRLRLAAAVAFNAPLRREVALPLTVLSAAGHALSMPVEAECMSDYRPLPDGDWHLRLADLEGREIPCQEEQPDALLPFNGWRRRLCFLAALPGLGRANFAINVTPGLREPAAVAAPSIDPALGLPTALRIEGEDYPSAGPLFEPLVIIDTADSWGANTPAYTEEAGRFTAQPELQRVIETGPVRTIVESVLVHGASRIVMHTIHYAAWPAMEVRLRVHWNEERRMLKLRLPLGPAGARLVTEVPGGLIERPADGQEHCHGRWLMVEADAPGAAPHTGNGSAEPRAFGLAHNGQHGLDFADGVLRLTALRSAAYCHEQGFALAEAPTRRTMDQGVHELRFALTAGDPQAVRRLMPALAEWLNAPPVALAHLPWGTFEPHAAPANHHADATRESLLELTPTHVRLLACRPTADGESLLLRVQESGGLACVARLALHAPEARIERPLNALELATLRIERDGSWREATLADELGEAPCDSPDEPLTDLLVGVETGLDP